MSPMAQAYGDYRGRPSEGVSRDGWISVKDRLPEETGPSVIISIDHNAIVEWAEESDENQRFFDANYGGIVDVWNSIAVNHWAKRTSWLTHWMPLPKPPEGK